MSVISIDTIDSENFTIYFRDAVVKVTKEELRALSVEIEGTLLIHDSKFGIESNYGIEYEEE